MASPVLTKLCERHVGARTGSLYAWQQIERIGYFVESIAISSICATQRVTKVSEDRVVTVPDIEDGSVVGLDHFTNVCVSCWPLRILEFVGKDVAIQQAIDLDTSLHKLCQIVAEKVRRYVVVLVSDNVVKDHPHRPYLVALQGGVDGIANHIAFARALTWGANFCELLVAVEKRVVRPEVSLVLGLKELLNCVVVKGKY